MNGKSWCLYVLLLAVVLLTLPARGGVAAEEGLKELPSDQVPSKFLMLVTVPCQESLKIANLVFEDRFVFDQGLDEVKFPAGKLDWDFDRPSAKNSYHLWMHSLNTVSYLCNAHETTGNKKYLERALAVLQDWIAYSQHGKNAFLWYDHTVANRTVTLIYLYQLCVRQNVLPEPQKRQIIQLLHEHAVYLADPKNYSQNNHGVMMDKSLLLCALFLRGSYPGETQAWFNLAMKRITNAFTRDFTPGMVHVENSPAYHLYVTEHFRQMVALMQFFKVEPPSGIAEKVQLAEDYARYVTKPDGYMPMVGDTGLVQSPHPASLASKAFVEAGVMVMCNRAKQPAESTWLMFKSGYFTHIHKHADDLSFVLYAGSKDVLVDGGVLNYDNRDPYSLSLRGALAHNTIVVDETTYKIRARAIDDSAASRWKMFAEAGLINTKVAAEYDMARGYNDAYPGVALERSIVFLKPEIIVIYDIARSDARHRYSQIFRAGREMRISSLSNDGLQLTDAEDRLDVGMVQLLSDAAEVQMHYADREAILGYGTRSFNHRESVLQVHFTKEGKQCEFLTVIGVRRPRTKLRDAIQQAVLIEPERILIRLPSGDTVAVQRGLVHESAKVSSQGKD